MLLSGKTYTFCDISSGFVYRAFYYRELYENQLSYNKYMLNFYQILYTC